MGLTVSELSEQEKELLTKQLSPRMTKFVPHKPYSKQAAFLMLDCKEAFYGGAAGGGKSDALLMAALQYVDIPHYAAILFRRTFAELTLPEALLERAHEWLFPFRKNREVHWSEHKKTYTFPSSATLSFGYLEHSADRYRYQSAAFQFIGFDELTHFEENDYLYLFSRLRRTKEIQGYNVPLRMRAASNPGSTGHKWVKQRFLVEGRAKGRIFIPAVLADNPALDREGYVANLMELNPMERDQLLKGDWDISGGGKIFKREWFEILDALPPTDPRKFVPRIRYWDLAATDVEVSKVYGYIPAFTVGLRMAKYKDANDNDLFIVDDVIRFQKTPDDVEARIKDTAKNDSKRIEIWMEEEPGSSGKNTINYYRKSLTGYSFRGYKETGSKILRANRVSSTAGSGKIKLLKGVWNNDFLDELEFFPDLKIKDQVDAFSGAFDKLQNYASYSVIPTAVGLEQKSYWNM